MLTLKAAGVASAAVLAVHHQVVISNFLLCGWESGLLLLPASKLNGLHSESSEKDQLNKTFPVQEYNSPEEVFVEPDGHWMNTIERSASVEGHKLQHSSVA